MEYPLGAEIIIRPVLASPPCSGIQNPGVRHPPFTAGSQKRWKRHRRRLFFCLLLRFIFLHILFRILPELVPAAATADRVGFAHMLDGHGPQAAADNADGSGVAVMAFETLVSELTGRTRRSASAGRTCHGPALGLIASDERGSHL